jgi:hypothetical protein
MRTTVVTESREEDYDKYLLRGRKKVGRPDDQARSRPSESKQTRIAVVRAAVLTQPSVRDGRRKTQLSNFRCFAPFANRGETPRAPWQAAACDEDNEDAFVAAASLAGQKRNKSIVKGPHISPYAEGSITKPDAASRHILNGFDVTGYLISSCGRFAPAEKGNQSRDRKGAMRDFKPVEIVP